MPALLSASTGASEWKIVEGDVHDLDGRAFADIDLFSGGVPCPPFSIAGKQLGRDDDRDLFPQALRLVEEISPRAVLLENVRGPGRPAGSTATGLRSWNDCTRLATRLGGTSCMPANTVFRSFRPRFVLVAVKEPWAAVLPLARTFAASSRPRSATRCTT